MAKQFYCRECEADNRDSASGLAVYRKFADAGIFDNDEIQYHCPKCHERVEIVDKLCDHKWEVSCWAKGVLAHDMTMTRRCKKCRMTQTAKVTIVWPDA